MNVYGVLESQEHLVSEGMTWNTAPGLMNDPTPAIDQPVQLDLDDVTDILLTFTSPVRVRESTEISQALADFLNSDTNGYVAFMFAPAVGGNTILITTDQEGGGSLLEGEYTEPTGNASKPSPSPDDTEVARDVVLSWAPGKYADKHNVYLGTNFDDVTNADTSSPLLVSPAQDINSIDAGRLEYDQTYYWRVDEVNSAPDNTVFKGAVWNFTIESFTYPIPEGKITVMASSQSEDQGPENTINRSGIDANNMHSKETDTMWLSAEGESGLPWIQYEFDKAYKLHEMLVWNYNGETVLSWNGLKQVSIEYSVDGEIWVQLDNVSEFTKAPGTKNYASDITVSFGDFSVKYVRLTAESNWSNGLLDQYGLSEVEFRSIPVFAKYPNPESGQTDVAIDMTLGWKAGRGAVQHNVLISTDQQAVEYGSASMATVNQANYSPSLDLSNTYFWRVDEVNNANATAVWEGDIWNFTTADYIFVDDFESYNDIEAGQEGSNVVYLTWVDGYDNPTVNGSTMGYVSGSSLEIDTIHNGTFSVPLQYDNTTANISEVTANTSNLPCGSDWTKGSPEALILWLYGSSDNSTTEQIYVEIDGVKKIFSGNISQEGWQSFRVDLEDLGINLSNVKEVTIGFEKIGSTGGSGMVFIDDIALYRIAPASQTLATVDFVTTAPTPGTDDISNFVGPTKDSENISGGDDNRLVSMSRPAQGQTFLTGDNAAGYSMTGLWIQHVLYPQGETTIYMTPPGSQLGIRVTDPSASGSDEFVINSAIYIITGEESNIFPSTYTTSQGTGEWIHVTFSVPVVLSANTEYGFDLLGILTSGYPADLFFEIAGIGDSAPGGNPYTDGTAYVSGSSGRANNVLNTISGDRVFVVELDAM
ncbi:MAG: discoidin domain-containing protein [Sedimentisphaerales bacterium]|nr:discoidin domain-containing protein [Sedimentisphaerales bacterium]